MEKKRSAKDVFIEQQTTENEYAESQYNLNQMGTIPDNKPGNSTITNLSSPTMFKPTTIQDDSKKIKSSELSVSNVYKLDIL